MKQKINSFKRLLKLTKPQLNKIMLAALCVMIVNAAELLKPYMLKLVIDDFLIKKVSQDGMYSISSLGLIYIILAVIGGLSSFTQVNLINSAGQEIMKNLRRFR